jgi:hypothetical protein
MTNGLEGNSTRKRPSIVRDSGLSPEERADKRVRLLAGGPRVRSQIVDYQPLVNDEGESVIPRA